ncbi:MAG: aromatic ring-hydroxylating dioxygenase subunit alpha [Roseovarius sp.]
MRDLPDLPTILSGYSPGYALPRDMYTSQAVYELDIEKVWNGNWLWVGHVSQIPNAGDYFLFDYGPESIIVVRDRDGGVRAHLNVCRHRGSRVCTEQSGNARSFVCPYHAWTFELTGELRAGRAMGADFDPAKWGLFAAQVRVFQGMILVCASADAPDIDDGLAQLAPLTAPFGFEDMKIVHTASYPVPANWKLAVENYMECYHCAPSHQEYSRSHSLKNPADVAELLPAMHQRALAAGLPADEISLNMASGQAPGADVYYRRYPLFDGYKTGSKTGAPVAPLLGHLTDFDGGATDVQLGMLNYLLAYSDHVVGYRFVPRALQETDIQVVWMVHADAQEGRDYTVADVSWLWHVTSQDDERIIRHNQAGVNSHFFQPGPLAEMEFSIESFYAFYLHMIGAPV